LWLAAWLVRLVRGVCLIVDTSFGIAIFILQPMLCSVVEGSWFSLFPQLVSCCHQNIMLFFVRLVDNSFDVYYIFGLNKSWRAVSHSRRACSIPIGSLGLNKADGPPPTTPLCCLHAAIII
jgi:hypothetical protein